MSQSQPDIRPSPIAGKWYPGDPTRLAAAVDEFIAQAEVPEFEGELVGILSPHAGHRYSGPVAGYAFRAVQAKKNEVDVVALIGPSHYPYPAPVVSTGHDAYATPLGVVPVDRAALLKLQQRVPIQLVRKDPEHSLEIELPFLQRSLGQFRLIPLAMIDHSVEMAERLGHALAEVLFGQKALIVASSDLSHFYPQQVAHQLDQFVLDAVAAYDPAGIIEAEELGKGFACGRAAIAAAMFAARELGADQAQVVHYATSGDVTQDFQQAVGYGAAIFYRSAPPASS
jgi:AmmeMemoRadiSam system protein B